MAKKKAVKNKRKPSRVVELGEEVTMRDIEDSIYSVARALNYMIEDPERQDGEGVLTRIASSLQSIDARLDGIAGLLFNKGSN